MNININYEEIITKANERKERLQQLILLLNDAQDRYDELVEAFDWLCELLNVYNKLDEEGRLMLPKSVKNAFDFMTSTRTLLGRVISDNNGHNGVASLLGEKELT